MNSSIKPKKGVCKECKPGSKETNLTAGLCHAHYWASRKKASDDRKEERGIVEEVKVYTIPPRAARRIKQERIYEKHKAETFAKIEHCQYPGCDDPRIQLHHAKGRIEELIYDKRYFVCLCDYHHKWAEANPDAAKELSLSVNRLEK